MRRNLLQNLPEGLLERNPQLTTFDVRDNHLQNLPPRIFKMNGLLEAVLLDYNRLVEVQLSFNSTSVCNQFLSDEK